MGREYVHQPRAYDAQVSGFTWYLEKNPPGMAVDRYTGRVTWTPMEGGYVEVVLCARSVHGTTGRFCWTICVRKAVAARAFMAHPRFLEALRQKRLQNTGRAPAADSHPRAGESFQPGLFHMCGEKRRIGPALRAPPPLEERSRIAVPLRI